MIARTTAFRFKGQNVEPQQAGTNFMCAGYSRGGLCGKAMSWGSRLTSSMLPTVRSLGRSL